MSSGMKLRPTIRAPTRFGEGVSPVKTESQQQSMRTRREQSGTELEPAQDLTNRRVRRRPSPIRPNIVEYDPNLPPAPFPTLDEPRPRGEDVSGQNGQPASLSIANTDGLSQSTSNQNINEQHPENYVASNNAQNSVYTSNMQIMAQSGANDPNMDSAYVTSDSEGEEGSLSSNDSGTLRAESPSSPSNPAWNDVAPSLQVEIIVNLLEGEVQNWPWACNRLGLTNAESQALASLMEKRNKAIEHENEVLKDMRDKQLNALVNIDHSLIKENKVPPQLVLYRLPKDQDACISIAQRTNRELAKHKKTNLLHAKTSEVLTARQYLGRRGLSRNLAGQWGNGLVTMIEAQEETIEPETWEWKEDLSVLNKRSGDDAINSRAGKKRSTDLEWRLIKGFTEDAPVNSSNVIHHRLKHDPIRDFKDQTLWWHRHENVNPQTLHDKQAFLQWKLDHVRLEAKEMQRVADQVADAAQLPHLQVQAILQAHTQPQGQAQAQGANENYDFNDTEMFRYINMDGEMVPTGVDPTGLEMFKEAL